MLSYFTQVACLYCCSSLHSLTLVRNLRDYAGHYWCPKLPAGGYARQRDTYAKLRGFAASPIDMRKGLR